MDLERLDITQHVSITAALVIWDVGVMSDLSEDAKGQNHSGLNILCQSFENKNNRFYKTGQTFQPNCPSVPLL